MTQYSIPINSAAGVSGATNFEAALINGVMPDNSAAKVQLVALAYTVDKGDGTFDIVPVGLGQYLPTNDGPATPIFEEIRDAAVSQAQDLSATASFTQQTMNAVKTAAGLGDFGETVPVSLTDTTVTDLFVSPLDSSRRDLISLVLTNLDTADAKIDFVCGAQSTTIIVKAGETYCPPVVIRGIVDTTWTVALQDAPATGSVQITATARVATAFL